MRGQVDAENAQTASFNLFKGGSDLDNAPTFELDKYEINKIILVDLLAETKLVTSKSEGRRMIEQGAVTINGKAVKQFNYVISENDFTENGLMLKKGKKNIIRVVKK